MRLRRRVLKRTVVATCLATVAVLSTTGTASATHYLGHHWAHNGLAHSQIYFVDHTGKGRHFTSNAGWSSPKPSVGARVQVVYHRSDPELAYIRSFFHLWAGPVAMLAFALAAIGVAIKVAA